jgi:multidrug efflux pump subunit AcrA (membrane-fusion protein)
LAGCTASSPDRRGVAGPGDDVTPAPTTVAPQRPTYTVERGDVAYSIRFAGRVAALTEQRLSFAISGPVGQVHAQRDSLVQEGDLLAELDTAAIEAELAQANAALTIAQTRLDTAQSELAIARRRAEIAVELAALDLQFARAQADEPATAEQAHEIGRLALLLELAELELERLATTVDPVLQADVDAAALRVAELESQREQSVLRAPFMGRVLSLSLSEGQSVNAGDVVGLLADPSALELTASLGAGELAQVAEGMAAQVAAIGGRGAAYPAVIRAMPARGEGGPADTTIRLAFVNPDDADAFELGDRVTIDILVEAHASVLWLPPAAIRDFNGRKFVVIQDGELQRRADVTLGLAGPDQVEILSGVEEGEVIIGQ